MHGRLKVKTTAEQQEAKRKEREKKLKLYTAGMHKVFEKRQKEEYDGEILEGSAQLLSANPDVYTLWNIRKETFLHFQDTKSPEEMQELFKRELGFIENCLRVNPKSYGAWQHRCWVMEHIPNPDWSQELKLCNIYLEYDERNFHCWDYRRFVVDQSKVAPAEELKFTATKISSNFSNYSSWHYRSKLLPILHPDTERRGRLQEGILLQEYELVQNAFFTDPNDQSAWFYHRWLMGRGEKPLSIQVLYVNSTLNQLMVMLTQPVQLPCDEHTAEVYVDGVSVQGTWRNSRGTDLHSLIWIFPFSDGCLTPDDSHTVEVKINRSVHRSCKLQKGDVESLSKEEQEAGTLFTAELSDEKTEVLTSELDSCQQLRELEPDNKWCLLTVILLMRVLDPLKHEDEMLLCFQTLLTQDPYRAAYFRDLRSKFVMENAIMRHVQGSAGGSEFKERSLDVSGKALTSLPHLQHLCDVQTLDISGNQLTTLHDCDQLFCLLHLRADNNKLHDLSHLSTLPLLEKLSLKDNNISTLTQLGPLASCHRLFELDLSGNPVTTVELFQTKILEMIPRLRVLNGEKL